MALLSSVTGLICKVFIMFSKYICGQQIDSLMEKIQMYCCGTIYPVKIAAFWNVMPCSLGGPHPPHSSPYYCWFVHGPFSDPPFHFFHHSAYSSALKVDVAGSSRMLVMLHQTPWHHILKDLECK
jgi:hypothetical protein